MAAEEQIIKRIMPHSVEAEQSVIGAMILDKDAIITASELLSEDDFYGKQFGKIFTAIVELQDREGTVDIVTLQAMLGEKDVPAEYNSVEYLGSLATAVPFSYNIKQYCQIVSEKALLRRLIKVNENIAKDCYEGKDNPDGILEKTEKDIFNLVQNRRLRDYIPIRDIVNDAMLRIEAAAKAGGAVTGIPTGFLDLDYKLSGLQPSDLVLIAARPSMGKTAFALNIAQYIAFKQNMSVAIFSLEMSEVQLVNRLFSLESNVNSGNIRTGRLSDDDWDRLIETAGVVGNSNLIIDATPGISIGTLRSKCRRYKMEKDIKLIIIDYLQLVTVKGRFDSRQQEISEISRSLKALARELNVPVIALSQLSRAVEGRPDKRPMLSDLRESGAIEQDADVVMFIYRDDYYNKDTKEMGVAEINIAKQRNGPIGIVKLAWLPDYTKFVNLERQNYYSDEG